LPPWKKSLNEKEYQLTDIPFFTFADISKCGHYRWLLGRSFAREGVTALWIGVNPSTADERVDDQSIRKLYGFGDRLGVNHWLVANLFAYRATDVRELAKVSDPVGHSCNNYLLSAIGRAELIIAGWGRIDKVPANLRYRVDEVVALVHQRGKQLMCWGTCDDGSPRHPLMLSYSTPLEVWR
jgi:hypothetical protein